MANIGECVRCQQLLLKTRWKLQNHHIYPKRNFGNGGINVITLMLCDDHHKELENFIHQAELALNGTYEADTHDPFFYEDLHRKYFNDCEPGFCKEVFDQELSKQVNKIINSKRYKRDLADFKEHPLWDVYKRYAAVS